MAEDKTQKSPRNILQEIENSTNQKKKSRPTLKDGNVKVEIQERVGCNCRRRENKS